MKMPNWWLQAWSRFAPARILTVIENDEVSSRPSSRDLVLAREDDIDWEVAMRCPCGCGDTLVLQIVPEAYPRWDIEVDGQNRPTLHPSVHRATDCKAHFWLRRGNVVWCA